MSVTDMLDILNAVTGWEFDMDELLKTAERISMLKRMVNVKFGVDREDDCLPKRTFEPAEDAPSDAEPWGGRVGKTPQPFDEALDRYYELRGWDENGTPKEESLKKLNPG